MFVLLYSVKQDKQAAQAVSYTHLDVYKRQNMTVAYSGDPVFNPVSFEMFRDERVCVMGKNGAGKSSLLKAILGETLPIRGDIQRPSDLRISYVPQDTSFLSGSLSEFAAKQEISESLLRAILDKLAMGKDELEHDLRSMSAGQKKKS